jgi:hypothetical protein
MKKSSLFETICANSSYNLHFRTLAEKKAQYKDNKCFDKKYWAFVESLVPELMCPLSEIERFTKEKYDFTKHIRPLIKQKLIWIHPFVDCFPHSTALRDASLKEHGIVQDDNGKLYLQFYIGGEDPNKTHAEAWL